jgi:hypothetical protein
VPTWFFFAVGMAEPVPRKVISSFSPIFNLINSILNR